MLARTQPVEVTGAALTVDDLGQALVVDDEGSLGAEVIEQPVLRQRQRAAVGADRPDHLALTEGPIHRIADSASIASATALAKSPGMSAGWGPLRDNQVSAEYAAACWP